MAVSVFDTHDGPYLQWMEENPEGYVVNTARGRNSTYFTLHRSSCYTISNYLPGQEEDGYTARDYIKVCSNDAQEILEWAKKNRPKVSGFESICTKCKPNPQTHSATTLPGKNAHLACLETFVDSIFEAERSGSGKWGVYQEGDRWRLLVGNLIVCTVHKNGIWLALDAELLRESTGKRRQLDASEAWQWDEHSYPQYRQVPSVNGYYRPHHANKELRVLVQDLHFEFISKVAAKYDRLNIRSQANHDPGLIDYLREALGRFVPEPELKSTEDSNHNPLTEIRKLAPSYSALRETQREAVIQSRVGQGVFRKHLIQMWGGCAVTRCTEISLLKASHIKPWRDSSNKERLDPYNGLLLVPNLDSTFDAGLISFARDGKIIISDRLSTDDQSKLGLHQGMTITGLDKRHIEYLDYHRNNVFE